MNTAYMLMDLGHSVLEAPSAAHAIKLLESDAQFDVMITDYAMPGMTGLDLATKVKQLKPKLPIVLATGYAELPPQASIEFPRLDKPYTQEQLSEALEVAIRREGVFSNSLKFDKGVAAVRPPSHGSPSYLLVLHFSWARSG